MRTPNRVMKRSTLKASEIPVFTILSSENDDLEENGYKVTCIWALIFIAYIFHFHFIKSVFYETIYYWKHFTCFCYKN